MKGRPPLRGLAAGIVIAILAITVLAADQLSKQYALAHLTEGEPVPVIGDALQWLLVFNPGAAFSMGEGVTWVFTIALALVAAAIVFLAITRVRSRLWTVVLGLLLGGVLGNLTDRLLRDPGFAEGHVVDFILTPWMWFWTTPAIYNVADIFIVGGMISVALLVVTGLNFDGTRGERPAEDAAAGAGADAGADADAGSGADADDRNDGRLEESDDESETRGDDDPSGAAADGTSSPEGTEAALDATKSLSDEAGERETRSGA
ncbi:lipoprotein signal peptidase [Microbacterium faecale]|uniref:Lipoprotein signal peptidase n=1 Tax=Microbacterium faecale TaxID=1804630 RepID=A0A917DJJ9_9MICO|nr:signal peptidase II [Microbacterium faecale]GGD42207.1 lipoprotein signal peptidase [Microbacterium faecale]